MGGATGQPGQHSIRASDSNILTDSSMLSQKNDEAEYGVGSQWVQRMSIKNGQDNYNKDFAREL